MLHFTKPTLITITAPTCSGKNYLRDYLERELNLNRIVSTTTRRSRFAEIEGHDYYFINSDDSNLMEQTDQFAELITFRGIRYGVTKSEMLKKMSGASAPTIILEPVGLKIYEQLCNENNWDIFKVFVHTQESIRVNRLNERTCAELINSTPVNFESVIKTHSDRLQSILHEERNWMTQNVWDVIVPGTNVHEALKMVKQGIIWRNRLNEEPKPYFHKS